MNAKAGGKGWKSFWNSRADLLWTVYQCNDFTRWLLAEPNGEYQGMAHSCGTPRSFLRYSEKYLRNDKPSQT
jgi:hypothetical protein